MPARCSPFPQKIFDEMFPPLSENSYATKFYQWGSPSFLYFQLFGVAKLVIRAVTQFCSLVVKDFNLKAIRSKCSRRVCALEKLWSSEEAQQRNSLTMTALLTTRSSALQKHFFSNFDDNMIKRELNFGTGAQAQNNTTNLSDKRVSQKGCSCLESPVLSQSTFH